MIALPPGLPLEAAAAAIAAELQEGWNSDDADRFARPFEADADFVNVLGEHIVGRDSIRDSHAAIFKTIYRGSRVAYRIEQLRPLDDRTALLHLNSDLDVPVGPLAGPHRATLTLVLVQREGQWRVAALHNTLARARR